MGNGGGGGDRGLKTLHKWGWGKYPLSLPHACHSATNMSQTETSASVQLFHYKVQPLLKALLLRGVEETLKMGLLSCTDQAKRCPLRVLSVQKWGG